LELFHDVAKTATHFATSEVRHLRGRRLWDDFCNGLAPLAYMDFAECRGFTDPSSCFVVKLADADRLHVTHCVTRWERVKSRAFERIAN